MANQEGPGDAPLRAYWPAAKYVDWVGINGYLYFPQQTFAGSYVPLLQKPGLARYEGFTTRSVRSPQWFVPTRAGYGAAH